MYCETLIINSPHKEFQRLIGTEVEMVIVCEDKIGECTKAYLIFTPYTDKISNILGKVYLSVKIYEKISDNKFCFLKTDVGEFVFYKHE